MARQAWHGVGDAGEAVLQRQQAEGVLTEVSLRRLQVEPMQLAEPVAPIFP